MEEKAITIIKNCTMLACEYHIKNRCNKEYSQKERDFEKAKELAISALEKQIPKNIIFNSEDDREYEDYICPNCKDILQQRRKDAKGIKIYKFKYCPKCGQRLNWEKMEE